MSRSPSGPKALTIRALPYSHKIYVKRCSESEGEHWLTRYGHRGSLKEFRGCMHPHAIKSKVYVWLGPQASVPEVAHEFIHAAMWVLKDSGVPVTWTNDEALAYLAEQMIQDYLRACAKKDRAEMRALVGY